MLSNCNSAGSPYVTCVNLDMLFFYTGSHWQQLNRDPLPVREDAHCAWDAHRPFG